MTLTIRSAERQDAAAIALIYNHYITETCVTFETEPVSEQVMAERIEMTRNDALPWLVAEEADRVCGYAYASKWKSRCAYRFSVEATIYIDRDCMGRSLGTALYTALMSAIEAASMRSVIGGIALPNSASVRLHERLGFKKVGHFEKVGFKHDRWIDVGYWQLHL